MASDGTGLTEEQKKEGERAEVTANNITINSSIQGSGNTIIAIMPAKCRRNSGENLRESITSMLNDNSLPEKLVQLLNTCDAYIADVVEGCVKLLLAFRSVEGLKRFWGLYSSGEFRRCLGKELGLGGIEISEADYLRSLRVLEGARADKEKLQETVSQKWGDFEEAAWEYVNARRDTLSTLDSLAAKVEDAYRGRNTAKVSAGLIVAGLVVGGLAAAPFTGGMSFGASLFEAGSALLVGGLLVMGAWGLVSSVMPIVALWLAETNAEDITKRDVSATKNYKRAFDELQSAWSELKAFGTSDPGSRPSAFRVKHSSHRLFDLAADPGLRRRVRDPRAQLSVVGIPPNFQEVIAPAIIFQRKKLSQVVAAIRNVAGTIKAPSEEEIRTLLDDIKSHLVN